MRHLHNAVTGGHVHSELLIVAQQIIDPEAQLVT